MKKLLLLPLLLCILSCTKEEVKPESKESVVTIDYFEIFASDQGLICLDEDCQLTDTLFITTNKPKFTITSEFETFNANYLRIFQYKIVGKDTVYIGLSEKTNVSQTTNFY